MLILCFGRRAFYKISVLMRKAAADIYSAEMKTMIKNFGLNMAEKLRRRRLAQIRREFARCGFPLDGFDDSEIETALKEIGYGRGEGEIPLLTATTMYFVLRRLSAGGMPPQKQIRSTPEMKRAV